jgi:hypothetical protein
MKYRILFEVEANSPEEAKANFKEALREGIPEDLETRLQVIPPAGKRLFRSLPDIPPIGFKG